MPTSTKQQDALDQLRNDIIKGELKPSTRLNEAELSTHYHVSRTPLREAIRQLQVEGLVDVIPNKGARVAGVSPKELHELFEIRRLLEGHSMGLISQTIPEYTIYNLRKLLSVMRSNHASKHFSENYKPLLEFYATVAACCPNQHMRNFIELMLSKFNPIRYLVVSMPEMTDIYDCFGNLLDAFEARSIDLAMQVYLAGLARYEQIIMSSIQSTPQTTS